MYNADRSLSARLTNAPVGAPKMNFGIADKALRDALGEKGGLSIKGASSRGNVVQVAGLAKGTTAADVEVCFILHYPLRPWTCPPQARRRSFKRKYYCPRPVHNPSRSLSNLSLYAPCSRASNPPASTATLPSVLLMFCILRPHLCSPT